MVHSLPYICRKVWSCVCIYTPPNIRCIVLCSLWPCGYVVLSQVKLSFLNFYCHSPHSCSIVFSASVGLSFLQFTNMNCMRNLIITGLSLFLGISVPQFFNEYWNPSHRGLVHTNAGWVSSTILAIPNSLMTIHTCSKPHRKVHHAKVEVSG